MASAPPYSELFKSITLGSVRLPTDSRVFEWLDELGAIDPTADNAEQLLAALGLTERMRRMQPLTLPVDTALSGEAPPEDRTAPEPRLARGLQLILEGTYAELLDEGVDLVLERGTYVPSPLLPLLLPRAVALLEADRERALRYLEAGGQRARWLARQHPDWAVLTPDYSFGAAWKSADQPAEQARVLSQWRSADPATARMALQNIWEDQSPRNQEVLLEGMRGTVTEDDGRWLRERLGPKRKGVRRLLSELLLLAREPEAVRDFTAIARNVTAADGTIAATPPGGEVRDLLESYGGTKAPESLGQRLLEIMPPESWVDIVEGPLERFWLKLPPLELRSAARAILAFSDRAFSLRLVRFLLREEPKGFDLELASQLVRSINKTTFDGLFDEVLTEEKDALRLRGYSRYLALQRTVNWSERLSKAMVNRLLEDLHQRQLDYATQRDLALHWKQAVPLLDPGIFPWLRQQLHTTTERYDAFGNLATRMLQVTSFRSQLRQA
ncbi:hypothetical protein CLV84_1772 [Neolewinella xylanilytica]|uniref:Uncharacterized protein n=1 Tax=Neolewinella xylanilytica TaxID=1514080 RepID=A0A2S6IBB2_9BACT|nr:DUF5691 domain-containing protein [Neolewinella xylanilytica]PPK88800.1 hypothetical protein CLV84_1772 [Neolewinella xylanilytica]